MMRSSPSERASTWASRSWPSAHPASAPSSTSSASRPQAAPESCSSSPRRPDTSSSSSERLPAWRQAGSPGILPVVRPDTFKVFDGNDSRTGEPKDLYGWISRLTHVNGVRVFPQTLLNGIENYSQMWQDTFNDSERRPLTKGQRGASERQAMEGLLGSLLTGTSPPGAVGGLRERRMRAMRTRRSFFVVHLYASQNGEPCTAAGLPVFDGVLQDRSEAA